jgi:hypothetical protein
VGAGVVDVRLLGAPQPLLLHLPPRRRCRHRRSDLSLVSLCNSFAADGKGGREAGRVATALGLAAALQFIYHRAKKSTVRINIFVLRVLTEVGHGPGG